jgi:hypothetical protein
MATGRTFGSVGGNTPAGRARRYASVVLTHLGVPLTARQHGAIVRDFAGMYLGEYGPGFGVGTDVWQVYEARICGRNEPTYGNFAPSADALVAMETREGLR